MLRLENPDREFIREGKLELKRYANESQNHSNIPITLVLLDNMLIITKPKVNSIEIYKKVNKKINSFFFFFFFFFFFNFFFFFFIFYLNN